MHKIAAIIGTTGVGKSQLGVEICKALCGQVINADAMQVYKGLDIITNKMPMHERQGIPHHLMDFLDPEREYKVTEFERDASQQIEVLTGQSQLPVVVGGTNYYVQSLLWHNTLIKDEAILKKATPEKDAELNQLTTSELYERLCKVDSVMATKWHPSDRRKIMRSLNIFHLTGRPQSEIIQEQHDHHKVHGSRAKFKALIFWLYADPLKLNPRLDARVDIMIKEGLFDEIRDLRKRVLKREVTMPGQEMEIYQHGLWQAIGYKEFDPYFTAVEANNLSKTELEKIANECTERMKAATRRYAKQQVQWIRNKLLPTTWQSQSEVHVYLLNATDLECWNENVQQKAIDITKAFQAGLPMPDPTSLSDTASAMLKRTGNALDTHSRVLTWRKHACPVCKTKEGEQLLLNGTLEWEQHLKSRFHRKTLKRQRVLSIKAARSIHDDKKHNS